MSVANHEIIKKNPELNMRYNIITCTNTYTAMHWHNSMEIIYVLAGSLKVTMNNEDYLLSDKDFIVIDRKTIHSTSCKQNATYLLIQIPYPFMAEYIPNVDSLRFPCIFSSNEKDKRDILNGMRTALKQLAYLCEHQYDGYSLRYFSLLFAFLDLLVAHYKSEISSKKGRQTEKYIERLSLITEYVQSHYHEQISLSEAASLLSINPEYFARFFKKYMGITFLEYVYSVRLQHAHQDLINTDLSIQEIQIRNGFTTAKIFIKTFKEQYGQTPREARKANLLMLD